MKKQKLKKMNLNNVINIYIKNNKNCKFEGNSINVFLDRKTHKANNTIDYSLRLSHKYDELLETNKIINSAIERNYMIFDKFNKFIKISTLHDFSPTVRANGYFSSLSSIRQLSDTDDLSVLELEEKKNLIKMVELGFNVKIILILDVSMIMILGYTIEQYLERYKNLVETIERLERKYSNLEIVINDYNNMPCGYILDTLLLIQSSKYNFNSITQNYNNTLFESDNKIIENEILNFDREFKRLSDNMNIIRAMMQCEKISDVVLNTCEVRYRNYIERDK